MTTRNLLLIIILHCSFAAFTQEKNTCALWSPDIKVQQKFQQWAYQRKKFYRLIRDYKKPENQQKITPSIINGTSFLYDSLVTIANQFTERFTNELLNNHDLTAKEIESSAQIYTTLEKLYTNMVAFKNSTLDSKTAEDGVGDALNLLYRQFVFSMTNSNDKQIQAAKSNCLKWNLWDAIN